MKYVTGPVQQLMWLFAVLSAVELVYGFLGASAAKEPAITSTVFNITKKVVVRNYGNTVGLVINVSSPAIDYPPPQSIVSTVLDPKPALIEYSPEGTLNYIYNLLLADNTVQEIMITQTINMTLDKSPLTVKRGVGNLDYTSENEKSSLSAEICSTAGALRSESNDADETVVNIVRWMITNIRFAPNDRELGAQYCFDEREGACDEHADLFVALARCDGIPARRVIGYIYSNHSLNPHAWAEYYDGNRWVSLEPSAKNQGQVFAPGSVYVYSCVGESAYDCGVRYASNSGGGNRRINVTEQVYPGGVGW